MVLEHRLGLRWWGVLVLFGLAACSTQRTPLSEPDAGGAGDAEGTDGAADAGAACATGKVACSGVCVDLASDPKHCGQCSTQCPANNVCDQGACVLSCVAPQVACGGACIDVTGNHDHCGACDSACGVDQVCSGGACADTCPSGQVKCGTTCVDPKVDLQHCGASAGCGSGAGLAGAACATGQHCAAGVCACPSGWLFCGGACVDPSQDRNLCGATACTGSGAVCGANEVCSGGACTLTCPAGLVKCSGACVDPASDRDHCGATADCEADGGASGHACSAGEVCSAGMCSLSCETGMVNCAGTCVDPSTSRLFCGATSGCGNGGGSAGAVCDAGQVCNGGTCAVTCQAGLVNCGGTCVDPATSRAHCGATGDCTSVGSGNSAGASCGAGNLCVAGSCAVSCPTGSVNCGGACINPATDNGHCGAAGDCSNVGAGNSAGSACTQGRVCNGGACAVTCQAGLVNCGGACVDPATSRAHCGAAGDCSNAGAGNSAGASCGAGNLCVAGSCAVSCPAGSLNCGGVCINPATDNGHCGATGDCSNAGAGNSAGSACTQGQVCNTGACAVTCQAGLINCGGTCVDPATSRAHCGATGDCTGAGAGNSPGQICAVGNLCMAGSCTISCPTGSVNCGGVCINPAADNGHCGAAGDCSNVGTGNSEGSACAQGQVCNAGACAVTCQAGLVNCGGNCVDPATSRAHCGATGDCTSVGAGNSPGQSCGAGNLCVGGSCAVSCPTGSVNCGGVCINPAADNGHCGAAGDCTNVGAGNSAGSACTQGQVCNAGACAVTCQAGFVNCGGACIDPSNSRAYCGAAGDCTNVGAGNSAGDSCADGNLCMGSQCVVSCPAGSVNCGGVCVNPAADNSHCGAAGDCSNVGAGNSPGAVCANGSICDTGACTLSCSSDLHACNNMCVDWNISPSHCGGCDNVCSSSHITQPTCSGAVCSGACDSGWSDCDGDKLTNGCETHSGTDTANCGACNHACAAGYSCVSGVCQPPACLSVGQESSSAPGFASIIEYWPFDGTVGTITNGASVPAAIGSAGTARNSGMAYVVGEHNQAISLNGTNDYVDFGNIANFGTADFSIAMWLRTTANSRTQWILAKRNVCGHSNFYNLGVNASGVLIYEIDDTAHYGLIFGTTNVGDGAWHHVAFVRQAATMTVYIDGKLEASAGLSGTTNLSNATALQLGQVSCVAGSQNFAGQIDDLAIWSGYALTASDVIGLACALH